VFPLFCKVATPQQAAAVAQRIEARYLRSGGVVTSLEKFQSDQQWDFPNGWAPLQWATIAGLVNYDYDDLAREIARRFVALARRVYDRTGKMMEKYNVVDLDRPGGGGEYSNQVGFGWTNSIVRACIEFLGGNTFWR
jgi:alpha,alpha-trehalase